jgi:hypothetical protein
VAGVWFAQLLSMRKVQFIASALLLVTSTATAQVPRRFAVFGGYSSRADVVLTPVSFLPISIPNVATLNGWNASLEVKVFHFVGAVADVSGYYGSYGASLGCEAILLCVPINGNINSRLYSFLFGPQVSVSVWRFTPFAHALFGVAHINHKPDLSALSVFSNSDTSFADAFGGGLDFRIASVVSMRLQGDLLQTRFFSLPAPINFLTPPQNGFRGSVGLVLRF